MRTTDWRETPTIGWTESDGPGRPPGGQSRGLLALLAGSLGVVLAGVLASDALCPDHRGWVAALATAGVAGSAAAVVALANGWSGAAPLTALVAATGVAIGLLDTVHDPARGALLALGFGIVLLAAALLVLRDRRLRAWDRTLHELTVEHPVGVADRPRSVRR